MQDHHNITLPENPDYDTTRSIEALGGGGQFAGRNRQEANDSGFINSSIFHEKCEKDPRESLSDEDLLTTSPAITGTVSFFRNDVKITRHCRNSGKSSLASRGEIKTLSRKSRARLLHLIKNMPVSLPVMVTLTYPGEYPYDGKIVKGHLDTFIKWLKYHGVKYGIWWLEFQERGAPHFHMFISDHIDHRYVAAAWYKIVGSGNLAHLKAGTRVEAVRNADSGYSYALAYSQKVQQKIVPAGFENVGRFWGKWGIDVKPDIVVQGPLSTIAPLVRLTRKIRQTAQPGFIDRGFCGFSVWDATTKLRPHADKIMVDGRHLSDYLKPISSYQPPGVS